MIAVITNVTGIENELGEIIRLFYHDQVVYEERVETDHVVRHLREGQYHRIWMDDALLVEYPEYTHWGNYGKTLGEVYRQARSVLGPC